MMLNIIRGALQPPIRWFSFGLVREIKGIENIPKKGGFVIVANHESYLDPLIIKCFFDRELNENISYLVKKEVYGHYLMGMFFKAANTIPVDRLKGDSKALDFAIRRVRRGGIIGVFPEGTRSRDGKLHRGKTGAVRIALEARCRLVPVGIDNAYEVWPPHQKMPNFRKIIKMKIGNQISLEEHYGKKITKKLLRELTDKIMVKISKLCNNKYTYS